MSEDKMPTWCSGEKWCPLTATANVISKKWHPVIIHRLIERGGMGFNDLKDEVGGISSKVLSESLDDLEESGVVNRQVISEQPFRVKYELTERGKDLEKAINEMLKWGRENLTKAASREESVV